MLLTLRSATPFAASLPFWLVEDETLLSLDNNEHTKRGTEVHPFLKCDGVYRLLYVRDLGIQEDNFNILVDVNLLGAKIDNLVGISERLFHLICGHADVNGLAL